MTLKEILFDFLSLIYPRYCFACERHLVKGEELICTACILELPRTNYHQDAQNPLAMRLKGRLPLAHALAFLKFKKKSRVQRLLHALKYRSHAEIGYRLGRVYGEELRRAGILQQYDVVVPVPLHVSRLRQRGYNQSDEWARGLSEAAGLVFLRNELVRKQSTETQTKRTKLKRWENVKDIFYIKNPSALQGKRLLLVDDVVTTGATLESCGNALLDGGCSCLGIACIAVAV